MQSRGSTLILIVILLYDGEYCEVDEGPASSREIPRVIDCIFV